MIRQKEKTNSLMILKESSDLQIRNNTILCKQKALILLIQVNSNNSDSQMLWKLLDTLKWHRIQELPSWSVMGIVPVLPGLIGYLFIYLFVCFFCGLGVWSHGFALAKAGALPFESNLQFIFALVILDRVSWTICPGWPQTEIFLISASQVAMITVWATGDQLIVCFYNSLFLFWGDYSTVFGILIILQDHSLNFLTSGK
jgi:hypothetical protein